MPTWNGSTPIEPQPPASGDHREPAFTLIELLVVITIIALLLALLAPAMDRAIYRAELAVCAAQMKTIASGLTVYTADHGRSYPPRGSAGLAVLTCDLVRADLGVDDRAPLRDHLPLDAFRDPMVAAVDLDTPRSTWVQSSFTTPWFGARYATADGGKGMRRLGDRFEWKTKRFDFLATDTDYHTDQNGGVFFGSHPDADQTMRNEPTQDVPVGNLTQAPPGVRHGVSQVLTKSYWAVGGGVDRGAQDYNFARADGSVQRLDGIAAWGDERMTTVPMQFGGTPATWEQRLPDR